MDIYAQYFLNYSPKLENIDPVPPKPQNTDIWQSFDSNGTVESPKKALPEQYYFGDFLQNLAKVISLGQGLFLDFQ